MLQIAIDLQGMENWCGGDYRAVVGLAEQAERAGIDQICLPEHVVMGEDLSGYPFGKFSAPLQQPWIDPLTLLAAIAARTTRIRLCTGVLLTPLRPAVLLAKQLASLDVLSHGRLDVGVGTGWQQAEHNACHSDFADKVERMYEQVRVCQTLWREVPASFHGKYHSFDRLYALPQPSQRDGIPIWFGVPPGERNFARIAELGCGWMPLWISRDETARGIARLRALFTANGRDPAALAVSHTVLPQTGFAGRGDLAAALDELPAWTKIGVTVARIYPAMFCSGTNDYAAFLEQLAAGAAAV